ncbi:MAG: hypothetical protein GWN95_20680 [Gammaproteobacteria bacterium]|nr:hypothetical protein [Gammaproteobacteria bacterium]
MEPLSDTGVFVRNRTTGRLTLTEAGGVFYARAARALAELGEAEQEVTEHARTPRGHLRVSAPTFYGAEILSRHLCEFHRRYPDITLELILDNRLVDLVNASYTRSRPRPTNGCSSPAPAPAARERPAEDALRGTPYEPTGRRLLDDRPSTAGDGASI